MTANRWLSLFVFIMGCAFISTYLIITETTTTYNYLFKCLNSLQFLLAPSLYISVRYFVNTTKVFGKTDWLHFLPFVIYVMAEIAWNTGGPGISTFALFAVNKQVSFLVRDILPFQTLVYLLTSYMVLVKHRKNLKLITAAISRIHLNWLVQFLFILLLTVIIWINDALFELPLLTEATPFVYTVSLFFLAYFAIRQKAIFAFQEKDLKEITEVFAREEDKNRSPAHPEPATNNTVPEASGFSETGIEPHKENPKPTRLSTEETARLSAQLAMLMEKEKLFLDNDLNLPAVAEKLGINIHEASFLINETTKSNFYTFINTYRIEEAKKLLVSAKMEELNILGIAFASGFNSKTTFNTTFKKMVGISPSQYSKNHRKRT